MQWKLLLIAITCYSFLVFIYFNILYNVFFYINNTKNATTSILGFIYLLYIFTNFLGVRGDVTLNKPPFCNGFFRDDLHKEPSILHTTRPSQGVGTCLPTPTGRPL